MSRITCVVRMSAMCFDGARRIFDCSYQDDLRARLIVKCERIY